MRRFRSARFPALLGVLWAIRPCPGLAADRSCSLPNLQADIALRERWPDLVQRVRDELSARDDLDACARVALSLSDDSTIDVRVALPDGRSASRTALRGEDVVPTLQALLLVPVPAVPLPKATLPESRRTPTRRPSAVRGTTEGRDALPSSSANAPRDLGVELSVIGGARLGDGQTSVALGALSFLEFSGWLIGFEGRSDRYTSLNDDSHEVALELGAQLGQRLRFSGLALDVTLGPALALKGLSDSEVAAVMSAGTPPEPIRRESSSGPVPRLLIGASMAFSPRSVFHTFVAVDGAVGPARAAGNTNPDAPRLPLWTLGLALGATVGTP